MVFQRLVRGVHLTKSGGQCPPYKCTKSSLVRSKKVKKLADIYLDLYQDLLWELYRIRYSLI